MTQKSSFIPFDVFSRIVRELEESCTGVWCIYSRTTCHVRALEKELGKWIVSNEIRNAKQIMLAIKLICLTAISKENCLYWKFYADEDFRSHERKVDLYDGFMAQLENAMSGKPIDTLRADGPVW